MAYKLKSCTDFGDINRELREIFDRFSQFVTDANGNTVLVGADGNVIIRPVVSYAWADRPAAASNAWVVIRITDIGGSAGSRWISDGAYWRPLNNRVILGSASVGVAIAGTSAVETILGSVLVPESCMGVNGCLNIVASWTVTNSANVKTLRTRFGNADLTGDKIHETTQTTTVSLRFWTELQNRNTATSQIGGTTQSNSILAGGNPNPLFTSVKNTAVDQYIVFTGLRDAAGATASENVTLERYIVELIVP